MLESLMKPGRLDDATRVASKIQNDQEIISETLIDNIFINHNMHYQSGIIESNDEGKKNKVNLPIEVNSIIDDLKNNGAFRRKVTFRTIKLNANFVSHTIYLATINTIEEFYSISNFTCDYYSILVVGGEMHRTGRNEKGQLGQGDCDEYKGPQLVEFLEDYTIVKAAVGRNHTLFLTDRGTVYACGDNKAGQCGVGNNTAVINTPCKINFKDKVEAISAGGEFSMLIDSKGALYSFGCPEYGQLGHNTDGKFFITANKLGFHNENSPRKVPLFVERSKDSQPTPVTDVQIAQVACGNNHTCVVDTKGRCFTWGFGGYGRLGHAEQKDEMIPRLIKFFDGPKREVKKIWCGASYTVAHSNLGFFMWGQTKRTGEANMYPKPIQDLCGWDIRSVGCSATSIVVAADDSCIAWGPSPTYGELGLGENKKSSTALQEVKALDGAHLSMVACGMGHTLYICRDSTDEDKAIIGKLKELNL
ncbi:unnamed protein product, partial [Meganyctiphanes norvegica]